MPPLTTLPLFAAAALGLLLIPGPAVLYITTRSATQGWRAGVVSVLGVHTGTMVHVLAAVVGLSAVIAASVVAFSAVKILGSVFIGIGLLTDSAYALASAQVGRFTRTRRPVARRAGNVIEGGILIGLGAAALAVPHRRPAS